MSSLYDVKCQVCGIIEEADATDEQKQIKLINAGIYCINKRFLLDALPKIESNNAQGELYLTDIMGIGYRENKEMGVRVGNDHLQILGVNNCQDLEAVDAIMEKRMRIIS
jgi:bifunctional N-acetylglucosamine-1-phosphate-uridyltransferase/glucosamine-1-phosphate-acetyltransferase GlmU-like protein